MARCQVCDGPVVKGRCKLCGMPYRNDEIMYHLNEDRDEHYKHAAAGARAKMRENQTPLPDRKTAQAASKGKKPQTKKTASGTKKKQNQTFETAASQMQKRLSEDKGTAQEILEKRMRDKRQATELEKKKKKTKKHSRLAAGLVSVVLIGAFLAKGSSVFKDKYERGWAEEERIHQAAAGETTRGIDTDKLILLGILDDQISEITITGGYRANELAPGEYVLEVPYGSMEILVQYAESEKEDELYKLSSESAQAVLELHMGDKVSIHDCDGENSYALMFLIEQYDELAQM